LLAATLIGGVLPARARGAEVVVKAQEVTRINDSVAVRCSTRDDRNFKGYPLLKNSKPYVVSLSWQLSQSDQALMMLSGDESSRMQLFASGVSYAPRAIGSDDPPPPPPGRARAAADHWTKVSQLPLFKGGGRFFFMGGDRPRDFLFDLPASSGSPDVRFHATIHGKEYAVRCGLGN
jgi:hypothetical protein